MPIEVKNVSAVYGENHPHAVTALRDITFSAADGEFIGIMGPTGSGKSTLLQLIAGLLPPASGQIMIDGADIADPRYDRALLRRTVGVVFQYPERQLFAATVEKDVAFGLKHSGLSREETGERVHWALTAMGFSYEEIRYRSPLSLSGGEKRRAAIAGVLAVRPKILLLDEPVAGMDPPARRAFAELLARLNCTGTTVLAVSHNADFLCECARRILVLEDGALAADGTPEEIFADDRRARAWQIGPGSVRQIAGMLRENGLPVRGSITRYDELLTAIRDAKEDGR